MPASLAAVQAAPVVPLEPVPVEKHDISPATLGLLVVLVAILATVWRRRRQRRRPPHG